MKTASPVRVAIRAAFSFLKRHPWRSIISLTLCALGPIGVVATGLLAQVQVADAQEGLRRFGGRLVVVSPNKTPPYPGRPRQIGHFISLQPEDGDYLASNVAHVDAAVPVAVRDTTLRSGLRAVRVRLVGTTGNYLEVRGFNLALGRFLTAADGTERVIVLGHAVSQELSDQGMRPGESVYLGVSPYRVVGILWPQGVNFAGEDEDRQVFIPLDAYRQRIANRPWLDHIYLQLSPEADVAATLQEVQEVLRNAHGRWRDQVDDVVVRDFADLAARTTELSTAVLWVVSVTAGLILILSAVGIATLMLLMVRERKTEIALRRALGATPIDLSLQFFVEGVVLASMGVMSGLTLSVVGSNVMMRILDFAIQVNFQVFILSGIVSLVISAISCTLPAAVAARVDPGVILRT